MKHPTGADTKATKDSYSGAGVTPAYYSDSTGNGTVVNAESLNMITMELINAITGQGLSLNATDDTQLSQVLSAIKSVADSKTGIHFVTPRKIADNSTISTGYKLFNIPEVPSNATGVILQVTTVSYERTGTLFSKKNTGADEYNIVFGYGGGGDASGSSSQPIVPSTGGDIYLKRDGSFNTLDVYIHGYII